MIIFLFMYLITFIINFIINEYFYDTYFIHATRHFYYSFKIRK